MAELEPGHPDELVAMLRNWLREAHDPVGSLPAGTDPVEWAVRRFIASWERPVRNAIESIEEQLAEATALCKAGAPHDQIEVVVDGCRQTVQEPLRDELGLPNW